MNSLSDLSDDELSLIVSYLSLHDRFGRFACLSKRLYALTLTSPLLEVNLGYSAAGPFGELRDFLEKGIWDKNGVTTNPFEPAIYPPEQNSKEVISTKLADFIANSHFFSRLNLASARSLSINKSNLMILHPISKMFPRVEALEIWTLSCSIQVWSPVEALDYVDVDGPLLNFRHLSSLSLTSYDAPHIKLPYEKLRKLTIRLSCRHKRGGQTVADLAVALGEAVSRAPCLVDLNCNFFVPLNTSYDDAGSLLIPRLRKLQLANVEDLMYNVLFPKGEKLRAEHLEYLSLSRSSYGSAPKFTSDSFPNLHTLDLSGFKYIALEGFAGMEKLTTVMASNCRDGVLAFAAIPNLERLSISEELRISSETYDAVAKFPKVTALRMSGCPRHGTDFSRLQPIAPRLSELSFSSASFELVPVTTLNDTLALCRPECLTKLRLSHILMSMTSCEIIGKLVNLTMIDIMFFSHGPITDLWISPLQNVKSLIRLSLGLFDKINAHEYKRNTTTSKASVTRECVVTTLLALPSLATFILRGITTNLNIEELRKLKAITLRIENTNQ